MNSSIVTNSSSPHYEFGENWREFLESRFTPQRLEASRRHLLSLLNLPHLQGKLFLDIGCGSGLHSFAAWQSGAAHVTSFDYDPQSVEATRHLHRLAGSPDNWTVIQGDVLDAGFLSSIAPHDIVYSWGVLHHTGAMWDAIRSASGCVADGGLFCIALYTSEAYFDPSPEYWIDVKRRYNAAGPARRSWMEWWYFGKFMAWPDLKHLRNPLRHFRDEGKGRGMSLWTDIRDWLGGWPMEFAGIQETRMFCRDELGLKLSWMAAGESCTEYVFSKDQPSSQAITPQQIEKQPLEGPFERSSGHAFTVKFPALTENQENGLGLGTEWVLFDQDEPLTFPRTPLKVISSLGGGRYGLQNGILLFSTSDGSDPNKNGRSYSLRRRIAPSIAPATQALNSQEAKLA